MVGCKGIARTALATIMFSVPTEAAYLLNCRLMDSDTPSWWRKGCKWETVISECDPNEPCKVKRQNFLSLSAKAVLTSNVRLRTALLVNGTTAETASLASTMSSPGLATTSRATVTNSTVSGAIGGTAGTANGVVSGATGAVDHAVAGLAP
jgi:hypothetical protein